MQSSNTGVKTLPYVEKYRPKVLSEVKSHGEILDSLTKFLKTNSLPHLLFFGPPGTGKTSVIKCCCVQLFGEYVEHMTQTFNASNDRGIETVRTKIKPFVESKTSTFLGEHMGKLPKVVILDEVDSMTLEAQGMLRQIIEKSSPTTRFCLICNDIDKISGPLQSRCTLYRFSPICVEDMFERLNEISVAEKIFIASNAVDAITIISRGDMRIAINTLQKLKLTLPEKDLIAIDDVYNVSGIPTPQLNKEIYEKFISLTVDPQTANLKQNLKMVNDILVENNITIPHMLEEIKNMILLDSKNLTLERQIYLIKHLSVSEEFANVNLSFETILMNVACAFVLAQEI
jgi:DNA polymerase III delta prime subunit